ncbi:MAG: hypothetical protein JXR73_14070 [Candidatus Omnitrophica bacterium]|nr:hypothetical protein [Candidatus Omnitrophota bacterium]
MENQAASTESKLLNTLDKCLLKFAQALDAKFDPHDEDDIKLLRSFRIMLESRRKWAREYELNPTPEAIKRSQAYSKLSSETPSDDNRSADRAKRAPASSANRIMDDAVEEVVQQILAERAQSFGAQSYCARPPEGLLRHPDPGR